MNQSSEPVTILVAFMAGMLSFLSPCVLPLIPSYISYITGITFGELTQQALPKRVRFLTVIHSLLFIAGFTAVFVLLGASFTFFGSLLSRYQDMIKKVGGMIVILLGLHIAGVINLSFLQREKKFEIKTRPLGFLGSFLVGATFSLGWTPCVGPILSSILILSSTADEIGKGVVLLLSYSLGLGLPFFLSSLLINNFLAYFNKVKGYLRAISIISGLFIIIIGVMILTNSFGLVLNYFLVYY
ncbi:MAG: cytochrome C biogenesis protein [Omnitrophica WOR_2 bacterium SM23_29]|nr:MAG: cytochrome C biogenesis protein [Omnitrophica WOR_2 bacterium SM23_29]